MVECGDIIEYPDGYMIVEKIDGDWIIGHRLTQMVKFSSKNLIKVVNSDFRYKESLFKSN